MICNYYMLVNAIFYLTLLTVKSENNIINNYGNETEISSSSLNTNKSENLPPISEENAMSSEIRSPIRETGKNEKENYFTLFNGAKDPNMLNSLTLGSKGVIVITDQSLRQRLTHFVRERIPWRNNAAEGTGARGYFICTNPEASKLSAASVFRNVGQKTPAFFRLSNALNLPGAPDVVRGLHGIAVKIYSAEGIWDMLTLDRPVFSIRDPILFTDIIHADSPDPKTNVLDSERSFDFASLTPQVLHSFIFQYADMGLPQGYRKMNTWPVHTFKFINKEGDYVYVRFKLKSLQGAASFDDNEAAIIRGIEPQWARRDLLRAIEKGDYPAWNLEAQILHPERAAKLDFNPFDPTKNWYESEFPYIVLGKFVIDSKTRDYFNEVEQVAFNPGNLIPGIQLTLDKVLQARTFVYNDAQYYRLGANFFQLKINKAQQYHNPTIKDGMCDIDQSSANEPDYYPSLFGKTRDFPAKSETTLLIIGPEELKRWNTQDDDNYSQPNRTYYMFKPDERERISNRIAAQLMDSSKEVIGRLLDQLRKINFEFYDRTKQALEVVKKEKTPEDDIVHDDWIKSR